MFGKTIVSLIVFLIVIIITYSIRIGTLDFRSQFSFLTQCPPPNDRRRSNPPSNTTEGPSIPLKVYMYDLPIRFNVGMLNPHQSGGKDEPLTARNLPPWPRNSGMRTQHSVEYWMTASLLYQGNETREAVRVLDPGAADVFFVPFFSSLSFGVHGRKMKDPETEVDRKLQVDILDFLRNSSYWQKSSGRDHVIPMHHPNAFRFLKKEVNASILIVSDFGRYSKIMANLSKDVVAPYVHFVDSFVDDNLRDPYESRTLLLFFRGGIKRKDEGIVRHKLEKVFEGYDDVHYEQSSATAESINASTKGMRKSKFCLHPAGDTPSSCRLFDAIVSHCVPVIVSDHIELPFEDELDYTQFSVFFSVKEALVPGYMVKQLRQFPKERWLKMWCRLKEISRHYEYQYPPKKEDAVDMIWREVKHKVPAAKLAVHRSRRLKVPDWW